MLHEEGTDSAGVVWGLPGEQGARWGCITHPGVLGAQSSTPPWHRMSETGTLCSSDIATLSLLHPPAQMRIVTSTYLLAPPFCCGTKVYKRTYPRLAAASRPAAACLLSTTEGLNLGTIGSLFCLSLLCADTRPERELPALVQAGQDLDT